MSLEGMVNNRVPVNLAIATPMKQSAKLELKSRHKYTPVRTHNNSKNINHGYRIIKYQEQYR